MKRSGFTMIELIFVIVIIGILAATALPKFEGIKDNAKAASEISAMSSMDGAITAAKEFRLQDYNDNNVTWHGNSAYNSVTTTATKTIDYKAINKAGDVLKSILKKGKNLKIIGYISSANAGIGTDANATSDILLITGVASDATNGLKEPTDAPGQDIAGKPDRNDFWVFNPTSFDLNVTDGALAQATVDAQTIELVDVNGTNVLDPSKVKISQDGTSATATVTSVL